MRTTDEQRGLLFLFTLTLAFCLLAVNLIWFLRSTGWLLPFVRLVTGTALLLIVLRVLVGLALRWPTEEPRDEHRMSTGWPRKTR